MYREADQYRISKQGITTVLSSGSHIVEDLKEKSYPLTGFVHRDLVLSIIKAIFCWDLGQNFITELPDPPSTMPYHAGLKS